MRCNPPSAQHAALQAFDTRSRHCFAALTGLHLNRTQWQQAGRGFAQAGLGLRQAVVDAPAAYLASRGGVASACQQLDAGFDSAALSETAEVRQALVLLNAQLAQPLSGSAALAKRQGELCDLLDDASWRRQLSCSTPVAKAFLLSETQVGARAFLAAVPRERGRMDPAAFVAELRLRLGIPEATDDVWCPRCDSVLDAYSHHAGVCSVGGERTLHHNAVRDLVCSWATRAGLQPEKEKPNLLLPQRPEDSHLARKRPADIFIPCLEGTPSALDFAITGPQRMESLPQAAAEAVSAAAAYAAVKASHHDTAAVCTVQGVKFIPMVAETTGAWDKGAARVLRLIAAATAAREGGDCAALTATMFQELSVCIRGFRARATLRRRAELHVAARNDPVRSAELVLESSGL
ncbi:unnamed protein product [Symbiodinium natans]|uniref:Uncharacterized protein n=1 Tax=Symbiodinium natans TaxID=878477 RepID=A0A812G8X6_9DINO|nr:unnamed protein product [Symbiodinium natans]